MLSAFLSLGSLPFLFYTSPNSWSTSLNLLFFYLTWTTLLLSHPPLHVEVFGTIFVRLLFFTLPSLVLAFFDIAVPSLSNPLKFRPSKFKLRKTKKTRKDAKSRKNRAENIVKIAMKDLHKTVEKTVEKKVKGGKELGWKVYAWSLFNAVVVPAVVLAVVEGATEAAGFRSVLRVARTLPLPAEIAMDMLKAAGVRELLTYLLHKNLLHGGSSGTEFFTSSHLSWQHAQHRPSSVLATYDHPVNYLLARWIPVMLPAVLLKMHLLTWYLWVAFVSIEELVAYCGYRTSVVLPFLGGCAARVDRHFEVVGKEGGQSTFSAWGVLDWVAGTGDKVDVDDSSDDDMEDSE